MAFEYYVRSGQNNLRCGFTTGTCASLAAKIACQALLSGVVPREASVRTAKGITVSVPPFDFSMEGNVARASVIKDAGDDSDVTDGAEIAAEVRLEGGDELEVIIEGGEGVGRVTRPGLNQPVGNAAINSGPREAITGAVIEVCDNYEYIGKVYVTIIVPRGREFAQKTFNPALGIEGGISILGTSGIVEPMSEKALVDTIELHMSQTREESDRVILTPGNIGYSYIRENDYLSYGVPVVKISNFVGEALDIAKLKGFREVILIGNIGKFCKLAAGIMNSHSRYADGRNEVFTSMAAINGASQETCQKIMEAVSTDAFIEILDEEGLRDKVMASMLERVKYHLEKRTKGAYQIGALTFSSAYGYLGATEGTEEILENWKDK